MADAANLEYARLATRFRSSRRLRSSRPREFRERTSASASGTGRARLLIARAQYATGDFRAAYDEAQALRERYPGRGKRRRRARARQDGLQQYPGWRTQSSLRYRVTEAGLLVRERRRGHSRWHKRDRHRDGVRRPPPRRGGLDTRRQPRAEAWRRAGQRWRAISRSRRRAHAPAALSATRAFVLADQRRAGGGPRLPQSAGPQIPQRYGGAPARCSRSRAPTKRRCLRCRPRAYISVDQRAIRRSEGGRRCALPRALHALHDRAVTVRRRRNLLQARA